MEELLLEIEERMEKALLKAKEDFMAIRTGKASPQLVENIKIDAYGSMMRLREIAGISTPEPRLIVIQPWDASNVDPIRKGIEESKLGVNPIADGKIIRVPIPELSEERRKDLIKVVKRIAEDTKVAIRHVRRDGIDGLKKMLKAGDLTEDQEKDGEKEVQTLTDKYTGHVDKLLEEKEVELMKV